MENNYDPFENVRTVMDEAAELGRIDKRLFEILKNPQREVKVYLPVEMDDGTVKVFEGWRDTAFQRFGAVQGRNPLSPECMSQRSKSPCNLDDVEMRGGQSALRGSERRD